MCLLELWECHSDMRLHTFFIATFLKVDTLKEEETKLDHLKEDVSINEDQDHTKGIIVNEIEVNERDKMKIRPLGAVVVEVEDHLEVTEDEVEVQEPKVNQKKLQRR